MSAVTPIISPTTDSKTLSGNGAAAQGAAKVRREMDRAHEDIEVLHHKLERLHQGIAEMHSGLTEAHAWIKEIRKLTQPKQCRAQKACEGSGCVDAASRADPSKTALTLGTLFAAFHLVWIGLVWAGWAQPVLDFVFWAHMIQSIYVVKPFDPFAAFILVGFTFSTGFALGLLGAVFWNNLPRNHEQAHN